MNLETASKKLAYMLRHCTDPLYIDLNGGWAPVGRIIADLGIARWELQLIVETDSKQRYSYDPATDRIRANQGHSIPGVVLHLEEPTPPKYLFHGTATRFRETILKEGIKPMSRQMVHISNDYFTARDVGRRHGDPVVLVIKVQDFVKDGNKLFRSANGVWLAGYIPPEYICTTIGETREGDVWTLK